MLRACAQLKPSWTACRSWCAFPFPEAGVHPGMAHCTTHCIAVCATDALLSKFIKHAHMQQPIMSVQSVGAREPQLSFTS